MASPKPYASVTEESSVVQVLDSIEPLVTASSSTPSSSSARVMDSIEPLVPTVQSILDEPVADPSGIASGSNGSQHAIACSSDEEQFVTMPVYRSTGSDEIRSRWNWLRLFSELGTHDQCVKFAEERDLVPTEKICTYHHKPMILSKDGGQLGRFKCNRKNCNMKTVSRAHGTWFEYVRLPLPLVFRIMYAFSQGLSYDQTRNELTSVNSQAISHATIADWFNYCREVIAVHEIEKQSVQEKIGGPNKVVQIDESKCGKRKYNRGRHIEGHWIIGMIENGSDDLRLEVCPDNDRSAEILVPLIKKHVAEGSIIHTDSWKAYMSLSNHGYTHKTVNHSDPLNEFVAPDGTHTQRVESQWRGLKKYFRQAHYKLDFTLWLTDYSWRRWVRRHHLDPYEELLKAIKYVYAK